MICPLKFNSNTLDKDGQFKPVALKCDRINCQAWEPKAKYNPDTKEYEGDCRLFMLDRKVSGLITAHQG